MIDTKRLRDAVSPRLVDFSPVGPTLFRATESHEQRPIAIHFFDTSGAVASPDFDIGRAQNSIIRDEYFRVSGSLQWSIYFYLLCNESDYERILSDGRAIQIEADKLYARKLIRTIDQLEKEFSIARTIASPPGVQLPDDIAALWEDECDAASLTVLTSSRPYDDIVRRIENGNLTGERVHHEITPQGAETSERIQAICSLHSSGFGRKLDGRRFDFGDVNLFAGPNGSGKTSLLEAIEVWMCGGSYRNPGTPITPGVIGIQLERSGPFVVGPVEDLQVYRDRERHWYHVHRKRSVQLCRSFGRFTFSHADAAARLELNPDPEAVTEALNDLILGSETSRLRVQFKELRARLERRLREREESLRQGQARSDRAKDSISRLSTPTKPLAAARSELAARLDQDGWLDKSSVESDSSVAQLLTKLSQATTEISDCNKRVEWLPLATPSTIEAEAARISDALSRWESAQTGLRELRERDATVREKGLRLERAVKSLVRLAVYYTSGGIRLFESSRKRQAVQQRLAMLQSVQSTLVDARLECLSELSGSVKDCSRDLDVEHSKAAVNFTNAAKRLNEAKALVGRLDALSSDSLSAAREYIAADPALNTCPVCLAKYARDELLERVNRVRTSPCVEVLKPLQQAHHASQSSLSSLNDQRRAVAALLKAAEALTPTEHGGNTSLQTVLIKARDWQSVVRAVEQELTSLHDDESQLQAAGYSLAELQQILRDVGLDDSTRGTPSVESVQSLLKQAASSLDAVKVEIDAIARDMTGRQGILADISRELLTGGLELDGARARLTRLLDTQRVIKHVQPILRFSADDRLSDLATRLNSLRELTEAFHRLSQEHASVTQALQRFRLEQKVAEESIKADQPAIESLQKAIELIERLQREHDPQKVFAAFLRSTHERIGQLFSMIHTPREFDDITIDEYGDVGLRRSGGRGHCRVSQISSGQRSALGVALFLTMNGIAEQAPHVILMDDPVAHVDDLNVLALFDCLRDLVLSSRRQLFFTTASVKAAGLFRKKFDFLGEQRFRVHELHP